MAQESLEFVYRYKEINKVVSSENFFAKEKLKKNKIRVIWPHPVFPASIQ